MRVLAVVDNAIMVHIHDVVSGDILSIRGAESDPIIERVEHDHDRVRFYYRPRPGFNVESSIWMHPDSPFGGKVFIHDLKNERRDFIHLTKEENE